MKSILSRMAAVALTMLLGLVAGTANALTVDGAIYTFSDTLLGPNDYKFTLDINLTGYTGGGSYLGALAFNAGSFTSFNLISTPDGTGNWDTITGGLNASGCDGSGDPWVCISNTANSGLGYAITPLSSHPDDQYVFEMTGITLPSDGVSLKAQYVDSNGKKVGSLISLPVPVGSVPEPQTYAMLLAGLGLVGFSARRRMNNNA